MFDRGSVDGTRAFDGHADPDDAGAGGNAGQGVNPESAPEAGQSDLLMGFLSDFRAAERGTLEVPSRPPEGRRDGAEHGVAADQDQAGHHHHRNGYGVNDGYEDDDLTDAPALPTWPPPPETLPAAPAAGPAREAPLPAAGNQDSRHPVEPADAGGGRLGGMFRRGGRRSG